MKAKAWFILSVALCLVNLSSAVAQETVTFTVQERNGVNRVDEIVNFGTPIPRSWNATDVSVFRLRNGDNQVVCAQFEALARWASHENDTSAPIKWLLISFIDSVSAGQSKTYTLERSTATLPSCSEIQIDEATPGKMTIDTGAAQFELNTNDDFNIFNQVTLGGQNLLQSLSATEAIDYTPDGAQSIVSGGTPDTTARTTSVAVERQGEIYSVIKVMGSILDDSSTPVLDFTARMHFYAGISSVRVDFTVENNHPVIEGGEGQPANAHDQGAINSVYIGSLTLNVQLNTGSDLHVVTEQNVHATSPASTVRLYQDSSGTDNWDVYVGNVGWEGYEAPATPRLQSYCTQSGFEITGPGISETGAQALGWMMAYRTGGPCVCLSVRDFWQNFPKAAEVSAEGIISFDLFPNGSQFHHNLRVGEEKTYTVMYRFGNNSLTSAECDRMANAFNDPLFGVAPASWYIAAGVLGEVPAQDIPKWPLYERYVRVAFEPNPDYDPNIHGDGFSNTTLLETIDNYNFYGWQDYGDVPLDYEAFGPQQAGQMNLKYWFVYGMFLQLCRSGDLNWLDVGLPSAWHMADIDYQHIPDGGIQHWSSGAYYGHSQHDEPGNQNPNRNYNSPSVDLFFGVPGLLLAYHLTGEKRFYDTAMEGLECMYNLSIQFTNYDYPVFYRERANVIFAMMEGYRQTGDSRWLTHLQTIVEKTADVSSASGKQAWLNDPTNYIAPEGGPQYGDERASGFQMGQTLWTMGRYLDFCAEYGITDTLGVSDALSTYCDFFIDHMKREIPPYMRANHPGEYTEDVLQNYEGHYALISDIWFMENPYEVYLEVNGWALLIADVMAYAYKYTGEQRFLDNAALLYETGTIDQVWLDDPPVYMSTKDLVNVMNWGLVYMNQTGACASVMRGDIDCNETVNINDLLIAIKIVAGISAGNINLNADVDNDGVIGIAEFIYILRELAGL